MPAGQGAELLGEDHVVDMAVYVDQVKTPWQLTVEDVQQQAARRCRARATGEEYQVIAVEQRVVVKGAHGPGALQALADLDAVQQMAGDESASGPLHGQVVEEALRGRGRDGIGPRRLHSVDLDEQVDVLAGLERWQRAAVGGH